MTREQVASAVLVRRVLHRRRSCAISSEVQDEGNAHDVSKERLTFASARSPLSALVSEQVSMRDEAL